MQNSFFKRYLWLVIIVVGLVAYQYLRPLPKASPQLELPPAPGAQNIDLPWPSTGQAALGAEGYGLLASHGISTPRPIGSTAKIITALAVLKQKPIPAGGQGPVITLTQADVDLFNNYYSNNGSVTNVAAGEQITELQALQSLLLPSSNNMADTLANWAFGSKGSYLKFANQMIEKMGLSHTTVGDTNGFSDTTTSTAEDMVKLSLAAMKNPIFADIVDETTAQIPVEGSIKNTNFLLGSNGIIGIKTGHTDQAGGNYVFAAKHMVQGHQVIIVGAVLNQPDITSAIQASPALIRGGISGFEQETIIRKGESLGTYTSPWGAKTHLVSPKDVSLLIWKGAETKISGYGNTVGPSKAGTPVGRITVSNLQQSVINPILSNDLEAPSPFWRLHR